MKPYPFEITNLKKLQSLMLEQGVTKLLVKKLSPNDNSKNQVYLGGSFEVISLLPFGDVSTDTSREISVRDREKADTVFHWLDNKGNLHEAPNTKLILYPKYPEVRLSGFLKGCKEAPSEAMTNRYPGRLLFLGITDDGLLIGHAALPGNPMYEEVDAFTGKEMLIDIPLTGDSSAIDRRSLVLNKLKEIHLKGWVDSVKLDKDGIPQPYKARNGGGYTLEATLGIKPNGLCEPDFLGWEVKQHNVTKLNKPQTGGAITLITPEPDLGLYKQDTKEFVRKYGYPDQNGIADRLNFGGIHRAYKTADRTNLTLEIDGYDKENRKVTNLEGSFSLIDKDGQIAAGWSFSALIHKWNRKHKQAVYVPSNSRNKPSRQYLYGSIIEVGSGTSFLKFLDSMADGSLYLDPGVKLENASSDTPKMKKRNQFRIKPKDLANLYDDFEEVYLLK